MNELGRSRDGKNEYAEEDEEEEEEEEGVKK